MAKLRIGDIVEINTAKGLAYAHYAHRHKQYGALLRVFGKLFNARPDSFADLVRSRPVFMCFFPLNAAVHRRIVSIAGDEALPVEARKFPIFRAGVVDPATRKVEVWWLWDGEKEWPIGQLTAEQRQLSIRAIWNDTILVERIEAGWTPEADPT
ncbi:MULTISPECIES: hypothetical protein [unclassified Rhizobium]|uniref:hypothetical protein n=1 Tax=unclassified Rhizobium TaxID=2613769 RepID=UPI0007E9EA89|nr:MULTISPECIES: hypothetical protein [unclassified Rhizobium]